MFNSMALFVISFQLFIACNNSAKTEPSKKDNLQTAAGDTVPVTKISVQTDEHGCKTADGETWSIVRNSCIILSEAGIKLEPQDAAPDKSKPAYLVFTGDQAKVEIFLPTQKRSVIIRKSSQEGESKRWANGPLTLSETNGIYALDDEGKILYQGNVVK